MKSSAPPPASEDGSEKRVDHRSSITLKVDYKRINTFFADFTKNISKGGTFIKTTKPLDVGTEFVFVLTFPSETSEQLRLMGEVMWVVPESEATEERPAGMGIKFKFRDDGERQTVHSFVEKLMADTLGEHISSKLFAKS